MPTRADRRSPAGLKLSGLAPGTYVAQYWDTQRGSYTESRLRIAVGHSATLELPLFQRAVAIKVRRVT
ncbi:MAG TPA: hypothetical protein VGL99_08020 [Chloroflexota bacterium]